MCLDRTSLDLEEVADSEATSCAERESRAGLGREVPLCDGRTVGQTFVESIVETNPGLTLTTYGETWGQPEEVSTDAEDVSERR